MKYTVCGYYPESDMKWCGHIEAVSHAYVQWQIPENIAIIGVFRGHIYDESVGLYTMPGKMKEGERG